MDQSPSLSPSQDVARVFHRSVFFCVSCPSRNKPCWGSTFCISANFCFLKPPGSSQLWSVHTTELAHTGGGAALALARVGNGAAARSIACAPSTRIGHGLLPKVTEAKHDVDVTCLGSKNMKQKDIHGGEKLCNCRSSSIVSNLFEQPLPLFACL